MAILNSESFDRMLMAMAQQHDRVQDLLGTIFSFFARKSDFYTGASSTTARKLLLEIYSNYETDALEAKEKKKKEKLKRKATGFSCQKNCQKKQKHFNPKPPPAESTIHELTNKIAENLEVEVDMTSKLKTPSTNEPFNKNNDEGGDEDTDELKMQPNSGNGCDLFYYCWTHNVSEVQEFEKDDSFSPNTSMNEPVGKNKHPMLISPVVSCVFRFLNIKDIKKFRFVCREWSKTGKVALQNRASITFNESEFRRPVDFQFCLQNSASLFNSYNIDGKLTERYVPRPWTIEELTRFFDEKQKCIRKLELSLSPSDINIVKNFDISPWISKSPMVQKGTKEMTKLSILTHCYGNMLDIPLHLLQHIKEITLSRCRIRLEEGIRMCPTKLKLNRVTFLQDGIELDRIRINNIVDLDQRKQKNRRTEELALDCKESGTKYILDVRGNTTLDSLDLDSVEIVNGEISQWAIEKVTAVYGPYQSYVQMKIKELFLWLKNSVDLLHLPTSIQKLALSDLGGIDGPIVLHCRQPIVFPNLQYLAIYCLPSENDYSFLSYFMNCPQLTHLKIEGYGKEKIKSHWIANSVKTLILDYLNLAEDCYFTLDTLILQTWPSTSDFISLCEGKIRVEDFVIWHDGCWFKDKIAVFLKYRSSFSFCKRIYIRMTGWPKTEKFENSALKEHVDVMSSCYVFESGQKGRAISKEAFLELFPNHVDVNVD